MVEALLRLSWCGLFGATLFFCFYPVNIGLLRLMLVLAFPCLLLGATALLWRRKYLRFVPLVLLGFAVLVLVVPGRKQDAGSLRRQYVAALQQYEGTRYIWGGENRFGIDCSGLVQVVYHSCGLDLPRDAAQQSLEGETIDFVDEVLPGDLAFFDNPAGEIIHVGIIIGPGKILHASGQVKIDNIDHNGIFSVDQGIYTHSLRIIKRFR